VSVDRQRNSSRRYSIRGKYLIIINVNNGMNDIEGTRKNKIHMACLIIMNTEVCGTSVTSLGYGEQLTQTFEGKFDD
jgi:hypothetical protein